MKIQFIATALTIAALTTTVAFADDNANDKSMTAQSPASDQSMPAGTSDNASAPVSTTPSDNTKTQSDMNTQSGNSDK
jgi:hypothetical protein